MDVFVALLHLMEMYAVLLPRKSVPAEIQKQRLYPIHHCSKSRFGGILPLELIPQAAVFRLLFFGEQRKKPVSGTLAPAPPQRISGS